MRSTQCERARELASLRLDGELSELEEALLRTHRNRCAECAAFALSLEGFTRELRAAPLARPGRSFNLPRRQHTALRSVQFAAAAAAILVVAGVGSMLAVLGAPTGQTRLPQITGAAGNGDLRELRSLRRDNLVFASQVISEQSGNARLVRLS